MLDPTTDFIKDIILLILYILVFIFLSYILFKVNRAEEKSHSCTINMVVVCLQLSVLCKFFLSFFLLIFLKFVLGTLFVHSMLILKYFNEKVVAWDQHLFIHLLNVFDYMLRYLFLQLAIMLNISKWIYFYLVIIAHRKIRYDEIDAAIM